MAKEPPPPLFVLRGMSAAITAIDFVPCDDINDNVNTTTVANGGDSCNRLVSGQSDGSIVMWSLVTRRPVWKCINAHSTTGGVLSIHALSSNIILSHGRDGWIKLWSCSNSSSSGSIFGHEDPTPMHEFLVNSVGFCRVAILRLLSKELRVIINDDNNDDITALPWLLGVASNEESQVTILSLQSQKALYRIERNGCGMAMCCDFVRWRELDSDSKEKIKLISGWEDGSIAISTIGDPLGSINGPLTVINTSIVLEVFPAEPVLCLTCSISPSSESVEGYTKKIQNRMRLDVFAGSPSAHVRRVRCKINDYDRDIDDSNINIDTSEPFTSDIDGKDGIADVVVRPDGLLVAAGCWDGGLRLFGAKKLKPLGTLRQHSNTVSAIAFMPDRDSYGDFLLATGSNDNHIAIWRVC